jgi:hypothetical protein
VREERFTRLEELRFGRFSFNGQNPEVEVINALKANYLLLQKLMSGGDQSRKRKLAEEEAEEGEILDDTISVQELLPKYPQKNGGGFKMKQRSKKPKMRMSK